MAGERATPTATPTLALGGWPDSLSHLAAVVVAVVVAVVAAAAAKAARACSGGDAVVVVAVVAVDLLLSNSFFSVDYGRRRFAAAPPHLHGRKDGLPRERRRERRRERHWWSAEERAHRAHARRLGLDVAGALLGDAARIATPAAGAAQDEEAASFVLEPRVPSQQRKFCRRQHRRRSHHASRPVCGLAAPGGVSAATTATTAAPCATTTTAAATTVAALPQPSPQLPGYVTAKSSAGTEPIAASPSAIVRVFCAGG